MKVDIYRPTQQEREDIRPKPDQLKVSGDGVFATLQGEGITAGSPAVFLRLHYCNLACGAKEGWKCDTWYTWDRRREEFWREAQDWDYSDTAMRLEESWNRKFADQTDNARRLVVTGGEPLLQQDKIIRLRQHIPEWAIEIETNGTVLPQPQLFDCQFNCSPKLANSGNSLRSRYRPDILRQFDTLPNSWFKFVVSDPSDMEEIDAIVQECDLLPGRILIMPEGQTAEAVEKHRAVIEDAVAQRGWSITLRHQLIWFGNLRKT